jgi:hypothetical protein
MPFGAAVFIGGRAGVKEEWDLFGKNVPGVRRIPVASTGGAAQVLWRDLPDGERDKDLVDDRDYRKVFAKYLA